MVNLRRATIFLVSLVPFAAAAFVQSEASESDASRLEKSTAIPGKYIITLKEGTTDATTASHLAWVQNVHKRSLDGRNLKGVEKTYKAARFRAYAGEFDEATIEQIRNHPEVEYVEPDQIFRITAVASQQAAEWGLGTLSSRTPGSKIYTYDSSAGKGGYAYIIDTGLYNQHPEFDGGRAQLGQNFVPFTRFVDNAGHGTHVAGTIGGKTYGVAKAATLVSVKVLDNEETDGSIVLQGLQWAIRDIVDKGRLGKSVINMSLGGNRLYALNALVRTAYEAGIPVVAAAGNDDTLASKSSPGSQPNAITVGAIDENWEEAWFSNYGRTVDILAPGVNILSAWKQVNATGPNLLTLNGTSMAAPHITGLSVYLMIAENITTPDALTNRLKALGTKNKAKQLKYETPNLIAYNGIA